MRPPRKKEKGTIRIRTPGGKFFRAISVYDFFKNKQYSFFAKPEGWNDMPIHPKVP